MTLTVAEAMRRTGGTRIGRIVFDEATIAERVRRLGQEITAAYPDGELLVLGLLKGSFIFLADLVRQIERTLQIDFIVASSYGTEKSSSGAVRLLYDPMARLEGRHIVVVEDIIDTGTTLRCLLDLLRARSPESLAVCALLDKGLISEPPAELRFIGFQAPKAFLVGYGLDHAEEYRHLPFIADLS